MPWRPRRWVLRPTPEGCGAHTIAHGGRRPHHERHRAVPARTRPRRSPMPPMSKILARALPLAVGALCATAAVAAADPVTPGPATSLPASSGAAVTPHAIPPSNPPQNPFMAANPNSNIHNDTWMTDAYQRSGPLGSDAAGDVRGATRRRSAGRSRSTRPATIVSVCPSVVAAAAGARLRPQDAGRDRDLRHARRAQPARHAALPELHRRRLLLPRQQGPHLERDQDQPPVRARRSRQRPPARQGRRLRPLQGAHRQTSASPRRCPTSRAASGSSPRRTASIGVLDPKHRQDRAITARRGGRELLRRRPRRRLHRLRQAHVPLQRGQAREAGRRLEGRPTRTRASTSRARSTPARARRRRS